MATIRPNDNAPDAEVKYILATETFDLSRGGSFDSEDRVVLSDAEAHPWLEVEYPAEVQLEGVVHSKSVPYADDYLSAPNSIAFSEDEIRKAETDKAGVSVAVTAIEAGLDQSKVEEVGEVNVTLAADEADAPTDEKPAAKNRSGKKEN